MLCLIQLYPKTQRAGGVILVARLNMANLILLHNTTARLFLPTFVGMKGQEGHGYGAGLNLHFSVQPWAAHSFYLYLNSSHEKLG